MKKLHSLFSLLLLFGFLSSITGVNVYKHYCGDFLADVSFFVKSNPCADEDGNDTCSADKEMDCCEDKTEFYQLETKLFKQQSSSEEFILEPLPIERIVSIVPPANLEETKLEKEIAPPPKYQNPLYQEFQQLIFYG